MKPGVSSPSRRAFTMVEIALCLAIIGFALVAIIGVLPAGLNVQRENREDTIITQDASYLMDAIRSGSRGPDELTNQVVNLKNYWTVFDTSGAFWVPTVSDVDEYTPDTSIATSYTAPDNSLPLTNSSYVVGLLGRPKLQSVGTDLVRSNHVVVLMRAITGAATEKYPQKNNSVLDLGLNYRLVVEVHNVPVINSGSRYHRDLRANLHEVRLKYAWPVFLPSQRIGNGRQTFRSQASGQLLPIDVNGHPLYFFNPAAYRQAP